MTATYERDEELFDRCIRSLSRQTYRNFEHLIVRDGAPVRNAFDPRRLPPFTRYVELGRNWKYRKSAGTVPRLVGGYLALGKYIAYLDDDNEFLPDHLQLLTSVIESSGADFVYSMASFAGPVGMLVGCDPPRRGGIDTNLLMHRPELLKVAHWTAGEYDDDWRVVEQWVAAGRSYRHIPSVTVRYHGDVRRTIIDSP